MTKKNTDGKKSQYQERLVSDERNLHYFWEQWTRDGIALKKTWYWAAERANHRIQRMAVVHRTMFAGEIPVAVGTTVAQRTVRNLLFQGQLQARCPVACIPLTPSRCRL
ncbi:transposable element Tc1 transposase [Trichonephila clavipes]|nr:transposable element Tc1 transposase [Trichonephila clavipes]